MLMTLTIENVALIEKLELSFAAGFTALTGETGAGKSILIDAIHALLGGRTSRDLVRTGTDKAVVQGMFRVPEGMRALLEDMGLPVEEDGTLLLYRQFNDSGRSVCRVNGQVTTVGMLKPIGDLLIDIHGQHDSQSLLQPETHIDLLDLFAGGALSALLVEYRQELVVLSGMNAELRSLAGIGRERERTMDMLRFQIDELRKARLIAGEDAELERQSRILTNAEEIVAAFSEAHDVLSGEDREVPGAIDALRRAITSVRRISTLDVRYRQSEESLAELQERLAEALREIRDIRDNVEFEPKLQQQVEERLNLIEQMKRKYGETIPACLEYLSEAQVRLEKIENSEQRIVEIRAEIEGQERKLDALCARLHDARVAAAETLSGGICAELADLDMPKCRFGVSVKSVPETVYTPSGTDTVEFLISTNPGEPLKPLSRIASGGETARVMLAIKSMLAGIDRTPTLIFDEIDAGIGGRAAQKVGEKLADLAAGRQVFCVTHQAQIASMADNHCLIVKEAVGERVLTRVEPLDDEHREHEVTRLLSGEHRTGTARTLAGELLASARNRKRAEMPETAESRKKAGKQ